MLTAGHANGIQHQLVSSVLPAAAIALPAIGAVAVGLIGERNEKARNVTATAFSAAAFVACAAMFPAVMLGGEQLSSEVPVFFNDIRLTADQLGLVFALGASLIWMLATLYSYNYIQHEKRRTRYHVFSLLTEAATLGVFLASDFFVLFIFFELMGLLAYMLVVHTQTYEAKKAGVKYIFMTVYGGLSLLMGIFLLIAYAGGTQFYAEPGSAYLTTSICFLVSGFMIGGFGVKAGMVPLHVWLPLAHPAAPSPASALLSGVMIKAGAYGFLRIIMTYNSVAPAARNAALVASHGEGSEAAHAVPVFMHNLHNLGWVIAWLGVLTITVGMVLALFQDNMKRLLAYSSISQMGCILMGLGVGAYLGAEGGMGLAAGIYHIMNHMLFKSLLFLGVGAVYYATHKLDMKQLGGLYRRMPVTFTLTLVGGLGMICVPFLNAFVSKTLLHHTVVEALPMGGPWMRAIDILFMVTAGGTVCYILKLLWFTFFGEPKSEQSREAAEVPRPMLVSMGILSAGVVFFGLFPGLIIRKLILPALSLFVSLDPHSVHHLAEMHIYTWKNLLGIVPAFAIGIVAFLVMRRYDLFSFRISRKFGIDYYYSLAETGFLKLLYRGSKIHRRRKDEAVAALKGAWSRARVGGTTWRETYHILVGALFARIKGIPVSLDDSEAFRKARFAAADVAYGVLIIAAAMALLAIVLF